MCDESSVTYIFVEIYSMSNKSLTNIYTGYTVFNTIRVGIYMYLHELKASGNTDEKTPYV